jgi:hypothetical protein
MKSEKNGGANSTADKLNIGLIDKFRVETETERKLRMRLKRAMASQPVPAGLRERIREAIRREL